MGQVNENRTKKEDARVAKTKRRLTDSLLALMEEGPLEDISVTALCEYAHVNRNTFYAHYGSPRDVLDELVADLGSNVTHALAVTRRHGSIAWLTELCANIQENRDAYAVLLSTSDGRAFIEQEIVSAYRLIMDATSERIRKDPHHAEVFAFATGGSMAVIELWLSNGTPGTPDEIAGTINRLCKVGMSGWFDENKSERY